MITRNRRHSWSVPPSTLSRKWTLIILVKTYCEFWAYFTKLQSFKSSNWRRARTPSSCLRSTSSSERKSKIVFTCRRAWSSTSSRNWPTRRASGRIRMWPSHSTHSNFWESTRKCRAILTRLLSNWISKFRRSTISKCWWACRATRIWWKRINTDFSAEKKLHSCLFCD